ncbi:4-hydroxy-2-oxovalerate aldolase [Patulibacter sp. NPDC049589]|uniref:4-hydroxy-2-oxovalerate aldolase n=1 Tax=Patulibacter sp. NPDC049589 TaxID=3154731 RepID=UPI00344AAB42
MTRTIRVTDTTLRDGSHPMRHAFTVDQVEAIVTALDASGVSLIEVTHGDGLGGSSLQYGMSHVPELELIERAASLADRARIAVLLLPGVGTRRDLQAAAERGARAVRIATHCTEADISEQHFAAAGELGLEAIGFLMMAHMIEPAALAEQASLMAGFGARCVYIVDSAGAMVPSDVRSRVAALLEVAPEVGFHGHNNMGLGIGNTITAVEAGASRIDGCLRGLGAGAGNAATELLAAVLHQSGLDTGLDVFGLSDAAEQIVKPIMPFQPFPDRESLALGFAGVYSTFLLHAKRHSERLGIDPRDVLVELGRRKAVAGQEDWIVDVAGEIAARGDRAPAKEGRSA